MRYSVTRIRTLNPNRTSGSDSGDQAMPQTPLLTNPYLLPGLSPLPPSDRTSPLSSGNIVYELVAPNMANNIIIADSSPSTLPPLPVLISILDVYFTYSHNQPYCLFHEATFRQRFVDGQLPDHILFAILANAVRFSTHEFFQNNPQEMAEMYANISWRLVISNCFAGDDNTDLGTVQTVTLLSIFDFTGK
jgi:hypothetical protein